MMTIVCPHCQAKNEAGTELCIACGEPLSAAASEGPAEGGQDPAERDEVERWVSQLPKSGILNSDIPSGEDDSLPVWLSAVRAHADQMDEQEANELLDFLADLEPGDPAAGQEPAAKDAAGEKKAEEQGPAEERPDTGPPIEEAKAKSRSDLPDWVAALVPEEEWPETEADDELAEHLAEIDDEDEERLPSTAPLGKTEPLADSKELKGIPEALAAHNLPDWLAEELGQEETPDDEAPIEWPDRSARMEPEVESIGDEQESKPVQAEDSASESHPGVDTIDSVLDELDRTAMDVSGEPTDLDEAPSDPSEWRDPAQAAALKGTLEEMMALPDADSPGEDVDEWLDILDGISGKVEAEALDEAMSDADLDAAEVPEWMQSLKPEETAGTAEPVDLGPPEERGPLAGLRGVVPAATFSLAGTVDRRAARLQMTKEQRQQVALLRQLTTAQAEAATKAEPADSDSSFPLRLLLGTALLLVILLGLLVPSVAEFLPQYGDSSLPEAAVQAGEVISASAGQTALVAFDYTPAMAGELDPVADALLSDLAANDVAVLTISQVAAGVPMAERASEAVEGLDSTPFGYLPGEASGLRALGLCLDRGCDTLAGLQLNQSWQAALDDVGLIVILAADRDSLAGWLEQVGTQTDIEIIGGVTQAMGPIAGPYVVSGQLAGLVEGLPVSVAYGQAAGEADGPGDEQLASLTLAQWLAIIAFLASIIYFGFVEPAASAVGEVAKK